MNRKSKMAFTLDDGTTTLIEDQNIEDKINRSQLLRTFVRFKVAKEVKFEFITLTFIGTGCSVVLYHNAPVDISIDGAHVGCAQKDSKVNCQIVPVASGLPFGTHTITITA